MEIISIYNKKGGSGKTTTTHCLAAALTEIGKRILVLDLDPQSSFTFLMTEEEPIVTINDVFLNKLTIDECINKGEKFDYIGSTLDLTKTELEIGAIWDRESILKRAFENVSIENDYDYCLIDCPPSLGYLTLNALTVSDGIIIPCQCELMPLEGLNKLIQALNVTLSQLNDKLEIKGIIPTMLDGRTKISKEVLGVLVDNYREYGIFTPVRINSKLGELGLEKRTIYEIDKKCNGAKDYMTIAKELVNGW